MDLLKDLKLRAPKVADLQGIVNVVRTCAPYLTAHSSYIYWMNIQYSDTCAVAEREGHIVGFCSIVPAKEGKHFLHQLAVAPDVRRQGIAKLLLTYLLENLRISRTHSGSNSQWIAETPLF